MEEEALEPTTEHILIDALTATAKTVDLSKVDLNKIPEAVRPKVAAMLMALAERAATIPTSSTITIYQPSDMKRLIDSLQIEKGFADALETQKTFQLLRPGERFPDIDQVLKIFTPAMLAMATTFKDPTLVLRPKGRSFNDMVAAIDAKKTVADQVDTYMESAFKPHCDVKLSNHGAYIVEGGDSEMFTQDFEDPEVPLEKYIGDFAEYKQKNQVGGMDRWTYILLLMQKLLNGQTIDNGNKGILQTIFDEDPAFSDDAFPYGYWEPCSADSGKDEIYPADWRHRPAFRVGKSGASAQHYQFRRSVGGNVPSF